VNERIRSEKVRLVGADGSQLGIFYTKDAQQIADDQLLDLVEVAPNAEPPVAKIMDYGKFKYEQAIKLKQARKHQTQVHIKEIKFRPKIDKHDYETKKKHVVRFLESGAKVKITIMFRGREMAHAELGLKILDRLAGDLTEIAIIENTPKQEGRNVFMLIAPNKALEKVIKERQEAALAALPPERNRDGEDPEAGYQPAAVEADEAPEAPEAAEADDAAETAEVAEATEASK
jgi:translation initiation factor IF-3